jgi:hypothetical protein
MTLKQWCDHYNVGASNGPCVKLLTITGKLEHYSLRYLDDYVAVKEEQHTSPDLTLVTLRSK